MGLLSLSVCRRKSRAQLTRSWHDAARRAGRRVAGVARLHIGHRMDRLAWKPSVTVAAIIDRDGRFLLVEEETERRPAAEQARRPPGSRASRSSGGRARGARGDGASVRAAAAGRRLPVALLSAPTRPARSRVTLPALRLHCGTLGEPHQRPQRSTRHRAHAVADARRGARERGRASQRAGAALHGRPPRRPALSARLATTHPTPLRRFSGSPRNTATRRWYHRSRAAGVSRAIPARIADDDRLAQGAVVAFLSSHIHVRRGFSPSPAPRSSAPSVCRSSDRRTRGRAQARAARTIVATGARSRERHRPQSRTDAARIVARDADGADARWLMPSWSTPTRRARLPISEAFCWSIPAKCRRPRCSLQPDFAAVAGGRHAARARDPLNCDVVPRLKLVGPAQRRAPAGVACVRVVNAGWRSCHVRGRACLPSTRRSCETHCAPRCWARLATRSRRARGSRERTAGENRTPTGAGRADRHS